MKFRAKISKHTYDIFFTYVGFYYGIPFITHLLLNKEYSATFTHGSFFAGALFIPLYLVLLYILDGLLPKIHIGFSLSYYIQKFIKNKLFNLSIAFIFIIFSFRFFTTFAIDFRHRNSMSEAGGWVIVLFAIRYYIKAYLLIELFNNEKVTQFSKLLLSVFAVGIFFSLNSSFDIIFIVMTALVVFNRKKILFDNNQRKGIKTIRLAKKILTILFIIVTLISVVFLGIANKLGPDTAKSLFTDAELIRGLIVNNVLLRQSVLYASLISNSYNYFYVDINYLEALNDIIQNTLLNFQKLFGYQNIDKPELWSIKRINYLNLYNYPTAERAGTAPGIIASIFYLPYFPLNLLTMLLLNLVLLRKFDHFFNQNSNKLNFIGLLLIHFMVTNYFDSPIDLINIISPAYIFLIFSLWGHRNHKEVKKCVKPRFYPEEISST